MSPAWGHGDRNLTAWKISNISFPWQTPSAIIVNTIVIACSKVVLNLVVPLLFALLLNEVKNLRYKKFIQTAVYLPHFLSWVILASVILNIFGLDGIVNKIGGLFGAEPVIWFSESSYFRQLVIGTDVWKEFGFNAVIFLPPSPASTRTCTRPLPSTGAASSVPCFTSRCPASCRPSSWWAFWA